MILIIGPPSPGVEYGAHISTLFEQHGEGTQIFLSPSATYDIQTPISLSHDSQQLATLDYPADHTRAVIRTRGASACGITAAGLSHITLRNLIVDGCEPELGRAEDSGPMVFVGAPGSDAATVMDCVLTHTRGWTCLHAFDQATGTKIINNHVGPAGHPAPNGPWSDGISAAIRNGVIVGNTIIDATDGAIVLFCCPGTVVANNTIVARTRDLLGCINLVDAGVFDGDYTNTRVFGNRFISDGAYIKLGIGMGPLTWGDHAFVGCKGAIVENNTIVSGTFGFGFAAAGCSDVTVKGNVVLPGAKFEGDSVAHRGLPAASPFVKSNNHEITSGDFQPEFYDANVGYLIGIQPGLSSQARFYPGSLDLSPRKRIELKDASLELQPNGNLLVLSKKNQILWQSSSGYDHVKNCRLVYSSSGLQIVDDQKRPIWNPAGFLPKREPSSKKSPNGGACTLFKDTAPFIEMLDEGGNTIFASQYIFYEGFALEDGCFVAIPAILSYKPERPPPPVTWLYLESSTSQLVMHTSRLPDQIDIAAEIWRSKNFKMPEKGDTEGSRFQLQGDGNLVIYRGPPVWASATGGQGLRLVFYGAHEHGGARLELINPEGAKVWSTN